MKIAVTNIMAAFLWQMRNEHRAPFVNVNVLQDFSKYLNSIAKKHNFEYELAATKKDFLYAVESTSKYFHIMKVNNPEVGMETFIQLNHDITMDELYDTFVGPCEFDLRRILTEGSKEYIRMVAKVEKATAAIEMGMMS